MKDDDLFDLELRLAFAEDDCREKDRRIEELETIIQQWESWCKNERRRLPIRRRRLPNGWRVVVGGPRPTPSTRSQSR